MYNFIQHKSNVIYPALLFPFHYVAHYKSIEFGNSIENKINISAVLCAVDDDAYDGIYTCIRIHKYTYIFISHENIDNYTT